MLLQAGKLRTEMHQFYTGLRRNLWKSERKFPNPSFLVLYYSHHLYFRSCVALLNAWRSWNTLLYKQAYGKAPVIKTFPIQETVWKKAVWKWIWENYKHQSRHKIPNTFSNHSRGIGKSLSKQWLSSKYWYNFPLRIRLCWLKAVLGMSWLSSDRVSWASFPKATPYSLW